MKRTSLFLALSSVLLLSGCGIKPYAAGLSKEVPLKNDDVSGKLYYVEGKEHGDHLLEAIILKHVISISYKMQQTSHLMKVIISLFHL